MTTTGSPTWLAVRLILLGSRSIAYKAYDYLDVKTETIDPVICDDYRRWSSGEKALVDIALSLQSPEHKVSLCTALSNLDPGDLRRVLRAIEISRPDLRRGLL